MIRISHAFLRYLDISCSKYSIIMFL
uniref:Uncharacterized protein n=1 Tax=Heterorhabditis bacteriophora TaxID=37862 RepID=A0A1I7WU69_HETBA